MMKAQFLSQLAVLLTGALYTLLAGAQALFITPQGDVGIGTDAPLSAMELTRDDGTSSFLVSNSSPPAGNQDLVMLSLLNPGNNIVRFVFNADGRPWTFDNNPRINPGAGANSGQFRISKVGTGKAEFTVDGFGDGRFSGDSFALNHVNTSSRETKTDFAPVEEKAVLQKLLTLPISQWRYKAETNGTRHVGPVAEDFLLTFGLGDGEHISTVDASGVTLAALKGLHAVVQERDAALVSTIDQATRDAYASIEALEARNRELEARNADLEGRLELLETVVQQLLPRP